MVYETKKTLEIFEISSIRNVVNTLVAAICLQAFLYTLRGTQLHGPLPMEG
jgi:hypothetical protein